MRTFLSAIFILILSNASYADKFIMICSEVKGQRVDFRHDTHVFDEGADGYGNAEHVILFDDNSPDVIEVKWQAALLNEFEGEGNRKQIDEIMGLDFVDEAIVLRDKMKFTTVSSDGVSLFTTLYNFESEVVMTTRISMNGMGSDMAAYYKGRCERIS